MLPENGQYMNFDVFLCRKSANEVPEIAWSVFDVYLWIRSKPVKSHEFCWTLEIGDENSWDLYIYIYIYITNKYRTNYKLSNVGNLLNISEKLFENYYKNGCNLWPKSQNLDVQNNQCTSLNTSLNPEILHKLTSFSQIQEPHKRIFS